MPFAPLRRKYRPTVNVLPDAKPPWPTNAAAPPTWNKRLPATVSNLVQMNARAGDLKQQLAETAEAVEEAEEHRGRIAKSLVEDERQLTELFERSGPSTGRTQAA